MSPHTDAGAFLKLAELRFFRDLVDAERMKVFKAFDLLPQDYDEQIPHAIQRNLFKSIITIRQAASQGREGGESVADKEIGKQIGAYLGMSGIDAGDVAYIRNLLSPPIKKGGEAETTVSENIGVTVGCICQNEHRRGYCREPGCPHFMGERQEVARSEVQTAEVARVAEAIRLRSCERGYPVHPNVAHHLAAAALDAMPASAQEAKHCGERPYCDPVDQAKAFYLAMYENEGANWDDNENQDVWIKLARRYERLRREAVAFSSASRGAEA